MPSLVDMSGDGVGECVNRAVGELGACGGDELCPYQRWVHIDCAEVGKPVGHTDGQDRRCQSVSDQLGSDRVVGDFEGIDRLGPDSSETGIDALPNSPSEREVDQVLSGEVDQW